MGLTCVGSERKSSCLGCGTVILIKVWFLHILYVDEYASFIYVGEEIIFRIIRLNYNLLKEEYF